ncbi:amino acid ABC transporter permease [Mycobacterium sp. MS1601]|uniref:amino acid ABC transporter permease n=1 Tax=Mycobacterium sp. MS1601 TaxID=1936029 RepID=UPI0009F93E40|nr:amino acid ABC transporter permease [Mycobacterium sp. MS1601]
MNGAETDVWFYAERMLHAVPTTLWLAAAGTALALVGGALVAVCRMHAPAPVRAVVIVYIELIRGTPQLIQIFILYFGLTQFGVYLSPEVAGVLWLAISGAAYAAEILRAGLTTVPHGQIEAAMALSLGLRQAFTKVVLPQALGTVLPPLTTFVILQIKSTTFLFLIGVEEVLFEARLGVNTINQPLAIYAIAGAIFIAINLAAEYGLRYVSRRIPGVAEASAR